MSYILDALNKSEEEKKQHKTPGLNTIHIRSDRRRNGNSKWLWPTIGFFLITINVLFLLWYTADKSETTNNSSLANSQISSVPVPVVQPKPRPAKLIQNANTVAPSRVPPVQRSTSTTVNNTRQTIAPAPKPATAFSASDIHINNIKFSSHIYAEDSSLRMVVINGKRFKEGDKIAKDLELQAISQDGVIIKQGNRLIPISVISNWAED